MAETVSERNNLSKQRDGGGRDRSKFCGRQLLCLDEDAIRPAMRHPRSRRHRRSQLPVKIRALTRNVDVDV